MQRTGIQPLAEGINRDICHELNSCIKRVGECFRELTGRIFTVADIFQLLLCIPDPRVKTAGFPVIHIHIKMCSLSQSRNKLRPALSALRHPRDEGSGNCRSFITSVMAVWSSCESAPEPSGKVSMT